VIKYHKTVTNFFVQLALNVLGFTEGSVVKIDSNFFCKIFRSAEMTPNCPKCCMTHLSSLILVLP